MMSSKTATRRKKSFWELLMDAGLVNRETLRRALARHRKEGGMIEEHLIQMGALSDQDFARFLSERFRFPYLSLKELELDPFAVAHVPHRVAERFRLIAVGTDGAYLTVAMANPLNREAYRELETVTDLRILPVVAPLGEILEAIERGYRSLEEIPRKKPHDRFSLDGVFPTLSEGPALSDLQPLRHQVDAHQVLRSSVDKGENLIYLYGAPGSGRTTLALAYARDRGRSARVLTGSLLTLRYEENRQKGTLHQFLAALRDPELLVVDALEHVDLRQHGPVLTGLFQERLDLGKETVIVGVAAPTSLDAQALGHLLGRGLLVPLGTPQLEDFGQLATEAGVPMDETTLAQLVDAVQHHLGLFLSVLRSFLAQHGTPEGTVSFEALQPFIGKG